MQVFFDTEFTSLDANRMKGLISIGCVANGQEFYAELSDTWDESMCSLFVIDTVLPLLEGGMYVMGVETLAVRLKEWIERLTDKQVVMQSDSPVLDFGFIKEIFDYHGWPKNLRKTPAGIMFDDMHQMHRFNVGKPLYAMSGKRPRRPAWIPTCRTFAGWIVFCPESTLMKSTRI